ncbi:NADPH-dependent FMN reductase [Actinophytocola oryzae]|uniref:NAD(P)H-dependent FMN reductase n=1 Tax=Actinophytocola oryzae TaxID=502181 RepID=A0A4R7VW06_9PSEU|nr:NAD(P)H-dependent oxidoreductase [Actinophytocola oryzae]TDV53818.1 NAD(P)H-dependent FMN reductase [Actinophytocola oryzae]
MGLRIAVIVGSTREGRVGDGIAAWFAGVAGTRGDIEVDLLDLAAFDFPAALPQRATGEMRRFVDAVGASDGFVVVTPEYNRSFPASLKQAIDYGYDEWHAKPVGFVCYGCGSRGHHAAAALRVVFAELHTVTMRDEVAVDLMEAGPGPGHEPAATLLLDELVWWGDALKRARATRAYVA